MGDRETASGWGRAVRSWVLVTEVTCPRGNGWEASGSRPRAAPFDQSARQWVGGCGSGGRDLAGSPGGEHFKEIENVDGAVTGDVGRAGGAPLGEDFEEVEDVDEVIAGDVGGQGSGIHAAPPVEWWSG